MCTRWQRPGTMPARWTGRLRCRPSPSSCGRPPRSKPISTPSSPRSRTRHSPDYHHWLTPEQYADRFGASSDDIAKITAWLEQHNLHVTSVGRGRMSVSFTGTAGDVDQALQVSLHRYNVNGRRHFANTADPSLPTALQTAVRSIHGLHDFLMQPRSRLHQAALAPDYTSASGNHYLSPDDLGTIYNIKALWNSGYDGTGQKIVIAGQTRIALTDLQQFRAKFQLPAADPQVILVPNTTDPGTSKDDLGEADLDLEWAGATAPQASLIYVYSFDVTDAVQYINYKKLAPVLSVSYGLCEPQTATSDILTMQTWARQANAQGITWLNASGDSGGADCLTGSSGSGATRRRFTRRYSRSHRHRRHHLHRIRRPVLESHHGRQRRLGSYVHTRIGLE